MYRVSHRQKLILTLPGTMLMAVLLIGGGAALLLGGSSVAAAQHEGHGGPDECTMEHAKPAFGSTIVINSGEVVCSSLTTWGGNIMIWGEVRGDVVAFGGRIVVDGRVIGAIRSYAGDVMLQNGAQVYGDIQLCGGRGVQDTTSQLHGTIYDCPATAEQLLAGDTGPSLRLWSVLMWVALGLACISLLPEHVTLVRTTVRSKMQRSLMLGLLSILLAPAILTVLIALIISIPLAIIVAIGLIAGWALGTVAIGWLIGEYIVNKVIPQQNSRPLQIVIGLTLVALAGSLPYIGWFISIGIGLLGLGAVFLSRFGTRLYGQPKQPLPL